MMMMMMMVIIVMMMTMTMIMMKMDHSRGRGICDRDSAYTSKARLGPVNMYMLNDDDDNDE